MTAAQSLCILTAAIAVVGIIRTLLGHLRGTQTHFHTGEYNDR